MEAQKTQPNKDQQPPKRIKACAYLRVSSPGRDVSIEIQRERVLEFAARNNYEIIAFFIDEGRSGSRNTEKRVEWFRMLTEAKTAEWEVVICFSHDRFSRLDSFENAPFKEVLRKAGKRLHTIETKLWDWDSPEDRLMSEWTDERCN